jgi:hypothetical protein
MNFKCGKCFAVSSASAWDEATIKSWGEGIEEIKNAFNEYGLGVYSFTCPVCRNVDANPIIQEVD